VECWRVEASRRLEGRQSVELRMWWEEKKNLESLEEERVSMSKVERYPVSTINAYLGSGFKVRSYIRLVSILIVYAFICDIHLGQGRLPKPARIDLLLY
jgi:hypothetical protein